MSKRNKVLITGGGIILVLLIAGSAYGFIKISNLVEENKMLSGQGKKLGASDQAPDDNGSPSLIDAVADDSSNSKENNTESSASDAAPSRSAGSDSRTDVSTSEASGTTIQSAESEDSSGFSISDIDVSSVGDTTKLTWATNINSNSRVEVFDDFYVSDNNDSKYHSVVFHDLPSASVYNYKIIAESGSREVTYYGKFSPPQDIDPVISFDPSKKDGCIVVTLEDENGAALSGIPLRISGTAYLTYEQTKASPIFRAETSVWGEVEYCYDVDDIKVINDVTGEKYYSGFTGL